MAGRNLQFRLNIRYSIAFSSKLEHLPLEFSGNSSLRPSGNASQFYRHFELKINILVILSALVPLGIKI